MQVLSGARDLIEQMVNTERFERSGNYFLRCSYWEKKVLKVLEM